MAHVVDMDGNQNDSCIAIAQALPLPEKRETATSKLPPVFGKCIVERDVSEYCVTAEYDNDDGNDGYSSTQHHKRHQMPLAPKGKDWSYDSSTRRWTLHDMVEAEITKVEYTGMEGSAPDILEHWIRPSDTFSGICLRYGVTATQLRRANSGFSGTNLMLAPNPLKVPNIRKAIPDDGCGVVEKKIKGLIAGCEGALAETEAKSYLALNDWDLSKAFENAQRDLHDKTLSVDPLGERARFDTPIERVYIDEDL